MQKQSQKRKMQALRACDFTHTRILFSYMNKEMCCRNTNYINNFSLPRQTPHD